MASIDLSCGVFDVFGQNITAASDLRQIKFHHAICRMWQSSGNESRCQLFSCVSSIMDTACESEVRCKLTTVGYIIIMWDEITYPFLNFNGCTVEV